MTHDTHMTQMATSLYKTPQRAPQELEDATKEHMRVLYARCREILNQTTVDLKTARKSGDPIKHLIVRRREARNYLNLLEEHGARPVMVSQDDTDHCTPKDLITRLWQYTTQYE